MSVDLEITPAWFLVTLALALGAGVLTLIWGRRLPRQGDWLVGAGLIGLLTLAVLTFLANGGGETFQAKSWLTGWIWPREELGSLTVGVVQDALGIAFSALAAVVAGLIVLQAALLRRDPRPERLNAAAVISASGLTLAWLSITPWLAFVGITVTLFGGFIALGSRWNLDEEATIAARFGRERAWGMLFATLGACAMAASGVSLPFVASGAAAPAVTATEGGVLGAALLAIGLFIQLQPFPLLGWLVMPSETLPISRLVFGQVFPGWAAFAILTRFEPQLRALGIFPAFGWVALASAVLASLSGLLQPNWRTGLCAWMSAGLASATAALAFAGPWAGVAIALGVGLSGIASTLLASACEPEGKPPKKIEDRGHPAWLKVGTIAAAAAGSGFIGFVTAGGNIHWIMGGMALDVTIAPAFATVGFLLTLLVWKQAWMIGRLRLAGDRHWSAMIAPYLILVLSLGIVWTGTFSGGALPGDPDRAFGSALDVFFGAGSGGASHDESAFLNASWFHWGALVLGVAASWWTAARKQDQWMKIHAAFPRTAAFFSGGYGVDRLTARAAAGLRVAGAALAEFIDRRAWGTWVPRILAVAIAFVSRFVSRADTVMVLQLDRTVRRGTEVPAKLLQLVQSGDVQWYLFFAVGTGIAILIHFLQIWG